MYSNGCYVQRNQYTSTDAIVSIRPMAAECYVAIHQRAMTLNI